MGFCRNMEQLIGHSELGAKSKIMAAGNVRNEHRQ